MPIRTAIWRIGQNPERLEESTLAKEQLLEEMILASPNILSDEWMLIGRQEDTGYGGRIDLLALAPDGAVILIELKRGRTPRDVVAQALDYASWVKTLLPDNIASIYRRFAPGRDLAADFKARFDSDLDEDAINQNHQIIIVASSLDDSTERIVNYLSERGITINVLCFHVFQHGTDQLLSRSWLIDPFQTQVSTMAAPAGPSEHWNGEFYGSFGQGPERSWEEAVQYGFFCAGGGSWYSRTLQLLSPGDRVWVKIPGSGFVGVARVEGRAQPVSDFRLKTAVGEQPVLDVLKRGHYHRHYAEDPERCEYFVPVKWLDTVSAEGAVREIGLFGNQNSICKPTTPKWRSTIDRLKEKFRNFDRP